MAEHPDSLWQPYPGEIGRWNGGRSDQTPPGAVHRVGRPVGRVGRAMEILAERYARGEIDARELEERRAALRGSRS
jgi:hypothetical protein